MAKKQPTNLETLLCPKQGKAIAREQAQFIMNCGLPNKLARSLSKAPAGARTKMLTDWSYMAGVDSLKVLFDAIEGAPKPLDGRKVKPTLIVKEVSDGFRDWAAALGVILKDAEEGQQGLVLNEWFSLNDANPETLKESIHQMLVHEGGQSVPGSEVIWLHGVQFDLSKVTINKKPAKASIIVLPGGKVRMVSPLATMYFVVSGALAGCQTSGKDARAVFSGYVEVAYAKSKDDIAPDLNQDDALKAMFAAKPPIFDLDFGPEGLRVSEYGDSARKHEIYAAVTTAFPTLTAHYQGSYFYDMSSNALAMEVDLVTGKVYLVSGAMEKAWKRHTIAFPVQIRLENPDVGYFRTLNGKQHLGRRVPVILVNGINLPYLGMAACTVSSSQLAETFRAMAETQHKFSWAGDLRESVTLPEVGAKVTAGQTLVEGAPEATISKQDGIVSIPEPLVYENGMTTVTITVGVLDTDGEFKLRSQSAKFQAATVGFTGIDWKRACNDLGLPMPWVANGDYAILSGLTTVDPAEVFVVGEDAGKLRGATANGSAIVSLEAETTRTHTVYSPKAHHEGAYQDRIERFLDQQKIEDFVHAFAVTAEVARFVRKAQRPDVTLYEWTDPTDDTVFYIVVQQADALLAYDLIKVESSSVQDAVSSGRYPLEVAATARIFGMSSYSLEILEGGRDAFDAAKATQNIPYLDKDGVMRLADGTPLANAGVFKVNVAEPQSDSIVQALRMMAQDYRNLGIPLMFTNEQRTESGTQLISWVLIDPVVLRSLGGGVNNSPETLNSFFCQLCSAVANGSEERYSLIPRLAGKVKALANSKKNSKRFNRGSRVTIVKTVAGMTPDGWAAVSYHGKVVREMARAAGFLKPSSKRTVGVKLLAKATQEKIVGLRLKNKLAPSAPSRKQFVDGLAALMVVDVRRFVLSAPVGSVVRFPQTAPLPIRYWFPDAPAKVWAILVKRSITITGADGSQITHRLVPPGARRVEKLSGYRVYMSPRDTAWCHGDHDGDLRGFHLATRNQSKFELLSFDVEAHRLGSLKILQREIADPVVEAFKYNAKKDKFATQAVCKNLEEFHAQNQRTIRHQTEILGQTYNLAHLSLSRADRYPSLLNAMAVHAMWLGPYEVNLGGADDAQILLFTTLQEGPSVDDNGKIDVESWQLKIIELTEQVGWTEDVAEMLMSLNTDLKACQGVAYGWETNPLSNDPEQLIKAVHAGLFRAISRGCINNGKLDKLVKVVGDGATVTLSNGQSVSFRDRIREFAQAGAISAIAITRFYDEVYDLIANRLSRKAADDDSASYEGV